MNPNAYRTANFICTTPDTGEGVEFWVDWVPAIDGMPGRPIRGEMVEDGLLVAPLDDSDPASAAGRIIAPINDDVRAAIDEGCQHGLFLILCGPSGAISRTLVRMPD